MREATPVHPHGQRIAEIFSYRWKFLEADLSNGYDKVDWKTNEKYPIKGRPLWARHQDPNQLIGVRFGSRTCYAMLDIDANSPYLVESFEINRVTQALETIGINRTVLLRSSWSGGVHIYIPLPETVNTFNLACALRQCLEAQGLQIANGQLEIFPNQKPYTRTWIGEAFSEYLGHRLPLQPHTGSCLLDNDLIPLPDGTDLSRFFLQWDNACLFQDMELLNIALSTARNNRRKRFGRAKGPVEDWRVDLEGLIAEGWTAHGQTQYLLKQIATYGRVFERLSGLDLEQYVERIATSRSGYHQYCRHTHEIWRCCSAWARAVEKFYWPLGETPLREGKALEGSGVTLNEERAANARRRISAAMSFLRWEDKWDEICDKVGCLVHELTERARCSAQTLYKNLDLWHPSKRGVTVSPEGDTAPEMDAAALFSAIAESNEKSTVTHQGGVNEMSVLETALHKIFPPEGEGERGGLGERGEEGYPQPLSDLLPVENFPWGWCDG